MAATSKLNDDGEPIPSGAVTDVSDAMFEAAVVERSRVVPVVVDLWAEWCGPCRQLGPILEKVVASTSGAVELAKVDIDKNPRIAQTFKVQSIPAVYAMKDAQVVDGFMGAQGEAAVREFVERLLPVPVQTEVEKLLAAGDESSLLAALEIEPDNPDASCALAALLIDDGRIAEASELLERIPDTPEVRRLLATVRLITAQLAGPSSQDGAGVAAGPDHSSGSALAGDVDARLEVLLESVKQDPDARQEFIDLLEVLGSDDPRTALWRKRLSTALF